VNNDKLKGAFSEILAGHYLQGLGFVITHGNVHSRYGEIDLVAFKDSYMALIEVKSVLEISNYNELTLTKKKFQKIVKTFYIRFPHNSYEFKLFYVFVLWSSDNKCAIKQEHYEINYEDWN
jgi:Holliday junction resolvase-like predicted endonuclease